MTDWVNACSVLLLLVVTCCCLWLWRKQKWSSCVYSSDTPRNTSFKLITFRILYFLNIFSYMFTWFLCLGYFPQFTCIKRVWEVRWWRLSFCRWHSALCLRCQRGYIAHINYTVSVCVEDFLHRSSVPRGGCTESWLTGLLNHFTSANDENGFVILTNKTFYSGTVLPCCTPDVWWKQMNIEYFWGRRRDSRWSCGSSWDTWEDQQVETEALTRGATASACFSQSFCAFCFPPSLPLFFCTDLVLFLWHHINLNVIREQHSSSRMLWKWNQN